jgi:hypothetical protein
MQKRYTGSVYIGVVGPENEIGECRDSIERMARRPGDSPVNFIRATKGYEARQMHINNWYSNTNHEYILLLDHDQTFPADTLERLRSHGLPYVSGYYLRRRWAPAFSVWYKPQKSPTDWPMTPWFDDPERGKLHLLGASGWGCILMHRDVITAVRSILKGEMEVLEDDMDLYPYDLPRVMGAIHALRKLADTMPDPEIMRPALAEHVKTLEGEIKPLLGTRGLAGEFGLIGSDIRFPFYARCVGYPLYGDPDVRCAHVVNFPLHPDEVSAKAGEAEINQNKADRLLIAKRKLQRAALKALK